MFLLFYYWLCSDFTYRKDIILILKENKCKVRKCEMKPGPASSVALKPELSLTCHPLGKNITFTHIKRVHPTLVD